MDKQANEQNRKIKRTKTITNNITKNGYAFSCHQVSSAIAPLNNK